MQRGIAYEDVHSNEIFKTCNEIFCQFGVSIGDFANRNAFKKRGWLL